MKHLLEKGDDPLVTRFFTLYVSIFLSIPVLFPSRLPLSSLLPFLSPLLLVPISHYCSSFSISPPISPPPCLVLLHACTRATTELNRPIGAALVASNRANGRRFVGNLSRSFGIHSLAFFTTCLFVAGVSPFPRFFFFLLHLFLLSCLYLLFFI